jgi:hypothetical protein
MDSPTSSLSSTEADAERRKALPDPDAELAKPICRGLVIQFGHLYKPRCRELESGVPIPAGRSHPGPDDKYDAENKIRLYIRNPHPDVVILDGDLSKSFYTDLENLANSIGTSKEPGTQPNKFGCFETIGEEKLVPSFLLLRLLHIECGCI